ncbi:MerR family transcriptional regulator [Francisella tularensis subsp. novicida]|uniref:MerR family transcriptional regulator n=1 Tax=Francisella tularensis TaxID=263 RepID=UPI0008FD0C48|nr:MerR family transcriptional regulator [Francisella tularensis]APC96145.1 merR regulatory family protein [Francisella tularensis subsp. novicida]MBK2347076.1 MerR family transcriptional regulator [Francisella tularensis subsp. novicida]
MTKTWYVKEFSKLTGVSVRTLHHYDHINLLKPSKRLENSYRKYSEEDLLRLQQIVALKSFGFKLIQIKNILSKKINLIENLKTQSVFLEEKAKLLLNTSDALKAVISDCYDNKSINWKKIIKLIGVYHMTQQLEKTWIGKVLNDKELEDYAKLEQDLECERPSTKAIFEKRWKNICKQIKQNLNEDPNSNIGVKIGEITHNAIYNLYGQKFAGLKHSIWEKGFKSNANNSSLTPEMVKWLDSAMGAYWQNRNRNILKKIGNEPDDILIEEFSSCLREMYGNEAQLKQNLFETIFKLDEVPEKSKAWIRKHIYSLI